MDRRRAIRAAAGLTVLGTAGCLSGFGGAPGRTEETTTDPGTGPSGVYIQSFMEEMSMQGMGSGGDYRVGIMYTFPHVFWTVTGTDVSPTPIADADSVHLMAVPWDPETETVLPESGLSVTVTRDGDLVSEEVIYPMLSQPMGFHYGGNFPLPGDGTYTAEVNIGGTSVRRTGAFEGRFDEPATIPIEFEFSQETVGGLTRRQLDRAREPGALKPMEMGMMPQPVAPAPEDLPGTVLGSQRSDDAEFVVAALAGEAASRFTDRDAYLAVSARTRYNQLLLPAMALSAELRRGGSGTETVELARTLDPELDYHYGAGVDDLDSVDELVLAVRTPPQLARHEGYERAFLQMPPMTFSL